MIKGQIENNFALPIGTTLEGKDFNYKIVEVLGQGSFGITYRVELLGKSGQPTSMFMAMKEFFMNDFNGRTGTDVTSSNEQGVFKDYKRKFIREAKNISNVFHDNIIKIKEIFEANNTAYFVMNYINGGSLDNLIQKRGKLSERETLEIAELLCDALIHLHCKGLLHLDVKPGNIMMISDRVPILIDFGLSKYFKEDGEPESSTRIGAGTIGYAPIEQASYSSQSGVEIPATLDIYAIGATMYQMLTGLRPADASTILNQGFPYQSLSSAGVSEETIAIVAKAMSPAVVNRYQTVPELYDAIKYDLSTNFGSSIIAELDKNYDKTQIDSIADNNASLGKAFVIDANINQNEGIEEEAKEENSSVESSDEVTSSSENQNPGRKPVIFYVLTALIIIIVGLLVYFFMIGKFATKHTTLETDTVTSTTPIVKDTISVTTTLPQKDSVITEPSSVQNSTNIISNKKLKKAPVSTYDREGNKASITKPQTENPDRPETPEHKNNTKEPTIKKNITDKSDKKRGTQDVESFEF
ncbi:MAG: serine/threonine protein kinase [Prevotella sp.]|nr:serine/threonine protein kinase [Bacteroides sp.]MCM1366429.1 serine/threonine protein kinase [Prevotella sp.]